MEMDYARSLRHWVPILLCTPTFLRHRQCLIHSIRTIKTGDKLEVGDHLLAVMRELGIEHENRPAIFNANASSRKKSPELMMRGTSAAWVDAATKLYRPSQRRDGGAAK